MPRRKIRTTRYDTAGYLKTEAQIVAYLEAALENGDPRVIAAARENIQPARGRNRL